jgi:hypothetical protein
VTRLAPVGLGPAIRPAQRSRAVLAWALVGLVWLAICVRAMVGWVTSPDFGPAPILGPDQMSDERLIALRVLEALSVLVLAAAVWFLGVRPWRQRRELRIEALLILGGVCAFVLDSMLNLYDYLFAFNANSVNLGTWAASLPFHHSDVSSRFGEALLWGLPMYIYFCSALGSMGLAVLGRLPRRNLSSTAELALLWVGFFVFDFVVENLIIRLTDAYSFVRTQGSLTLWAGSQYQFPLYESAFVAFVALGFAMVRITADRSPDGLSMIERGLTDLPARLQLPTRALAAIGYTAVVLLMAYHLPFNWLSVGGDSVAHLPSYLRLG